MVDECDIHEMLLERELELLDEMLEQYRNGREYHWPTVAPTLISAVWEHYARTGNVVDDGRFERILTTIRDNILRLRISTVMAGHEQLGPEEMYDMVESGEDFDAIYEWIEKSAPTTPISDYGLRPLQEALVKALCVPSSRMGEKLKLADRILNIFHQRGDLSALLVTGGRQTVLDMPDVEDEDGEGLPVRQTQRCQ